MNIGKSVRFEFIKTSLPLSTIFDDIMLSPKSSMCQVMTDEVPWRGLTRIVYQGLLTCKFSGKSTLPAINNAEATPPNVYLYSSAPGLGASEGHGRENSCLKIK